VGGTDQESNGSESELHLACLGELLLKEWRLQRIMTYFCLFPSKSGIIDRDGREIVTRNREDL
jgi:hypothetical protein